MIVALPTKFFRLNEVFILFYGFICYEMGLGVISDDHNNSCSSFLDETSHKHTSY